MKRLLVSILVSTIMFGGCAHNVREDSLPPLDQQTQIPMNRLLPGDQLQQHQVLYGELADNQKIPPDGTIELIRSAGASSVKPCESSILCSTTAIIAYPFIPFIVLGAAIVVLPYLAAQELLKAPDTKAASSAGEPEINEFVLRKERERRLSQERHAQWLASAVMEGQWSSALDDAYILALNQALGWKAPPLKSSVEQFKQWRLGSGISKIVLLDSKLGERTLILCARSSVERAGVTFRYFETCQSGNIGPSTPYDSPASSEALRAVLVEQARKLAALQAKALTEQTTFVQVTHVVPSRNSDAITPDSEMKRLEPENSGSQTVTTQPSNEDYLNCVTRGLGNCDALVNCVSGGERKWTNRSRCD